MRCVVPMNFLGSAEYRSITRSLAFNFSDLHAFLTTVDDERMLLHGPRPRGFALIDHKSPVGGRRFHSIRDSHARLARVRVRRLCFTFEVGFGRSLPKNGIANGHSEMVRRFPFGACDSIAFAIATIDPGKWTTAGPCSRFKPRNTRGASG